MAGETNVKVSRSMTIAGRSIGGVDELVPAPIQVGWGQTVPNGTIDLPVDLAFDAATSLAQALHSSEQIEVHCNLASTVTTAHQSIAVAKNSAQLWTSNEPTAGQVFTAANTVLYITNLSGADAKVAVGVGLPD